MKAFIKYFYKEGNWKNAALSKNEVMIDCKQFYLIPDYKNQWKVLL